MVVRRPWRRRLVGAVIAALALVCATWLATRPRGGARLVRAPVADAVRGEPVALPQDAAAAAPLPSAPSLASVRHGPDEVQLCNGAWVKSEPDSAASQADFERAIKLPQTRAAILATLNAAPDDMSRLAALVLTTTDRGEAHRLALIGVPATCEGAECVAVAAAEADVAQAREAIARAALTSTDPKVYALALNVCNRHREGTCEQLSARQWARIDPGNARPWMQVLSEARASKDDAAQAEALYRIANAQREGFGASLLASAVLKAAPADDDESVEATLTMAMSALGVEMAWAPNYQALMQLCTADALRDANRAQVCAGVAETLIDRSDSLLSRNIGAALGRRLGWPAERSDLVRAELDAYSDISNLPLGGPGRESSCARTRYWLGRMARMAALGEVGAMREWIARSGKKPQDLVREERARQREALREAQAAASAAPNPAR